MRKRLAASFALAVVALGAVAIETTALVLYFKERGKLYYTDHRERVAAPTPYAASGAVFHPYIGYVLRTHRDGEWWTTNNVGFQYVKDPTKTDPTWFDYPVRTDDLIIGVFGGSVATGLAFALQKSPDLARAIAARPEWQGRSVRVLNFAMPGYKQPQQSAALAYFASLGQRFDVLVNVDGFNEVVTSHRNWAAGVEPSYPADTLWGEWGRLLEKAGTTGKPTSAQSHLESYLRLSVPQWRQRADRCTLAMCFTAVNLAADLASRRAARLAARLQPGAETSSLYPTAIKSPLEAERDVFEQTAEQWAAASKVMADLAQARGWTYLHVLQPNQWWRKVSGEYSPIDPAHPHGWVIELVNQGYPRFVERIPALQASGVAVLDATALFRDRASRDVYSDDCCHYTDGGNAMLAEAIARAITRPTKKPH